MDKQAGVLSNAEKIILMRNLAQELKEQVANMPIIMKSQAMPVLSPMVEILDCMVDFVEELDKQVIGHALGVGFIALGRTIDPMIRIEKEGL